jgi:hypothetical protein
MINDQGKQSRGHDPLVKPHLQLQVRTLLVESRDAEKLRRLLQIKQRQKEETLDMEGTQRLVTERK